MPRPASETMHTRHVRLGDLVQARFPVRISRRKLQSCCKGLSIQECAVPTSPAFGAGDMARTRRRLVGNRDSLPPSVGTMCPSNRLAQQGNGNDPGTLLEDMWRR